MKDAIQRAFKRAKEKNWEKIYVLVDIHGTIFNPTYSKNEKFEWYPFSKQTLQYLSKRHDICLILWTSSFKEDIEKYLDEFRKNEIKFDYINENPEVKNTELCCFEQKLYFNIGIDDKFGFNADEYGWYEILDTFMNEEI